MKKFIYLMLIAAASCKKTDYVLSDSTIGWTPVISGTMSMKINGVETDLFKPAASWERINNDVIYHMGAKLFADNNFVLRSISFGFPYFKVGEYQIQYPSSTFNHLQVVSGYAYMNHDAVETGYYLDTTKPALLKISSVDSVTKEMTGSFYATYLKQHYGGISANRPDIVSITDGRFKVKLVN